MFQKIVVRNFQRHVKMALEFSEGVTTIVGPSDCGKSSLLRAIRLVCLNRPQGAGYVLHGSDLASVILRVDGHRIARRRGNGVNTYRLDDSEFKAFGNEVPAEVANLLRVDDASFQMQADSPFWFGDSSGNVSKSLNEVVNLQSIDKALAFVADEVRKAKAAEESAVNTLTETRNLKKSLKWIPVFDADLQKLESLHEKSQGKASRLARLRELLTDASTQQRKLGGASEATRDGDKLVKSGAEALATSETRQHLEGLIQKARQARKHSKIIVPDIGALLVRRKEADNVAEERRSLEYLVNQAKNAKKELKELRTKLEKAESQLAEVKVCPTCGTPLRSSQPTFTCDTPHPSHGKRKTGTK